MTPQNKSISSFLELFNNGAERFQKDPLFRQVIMELMNGAPPLSIIDRLLDLMNENREYTERLLTEGYGITYIIKKNTQKHF
jgi:hypothetical protein